MNDKRKSAGGYNQGTVDFARKLFAASVSHRLGIGLEYALKRYASEEVPGEFWLKLAQDLEAELVGELGRALSPRSEGPLQ